MRKKQDCQRSGLEISRGMTGIRPLIHIDAHPLYWTISKEGIFMRYSYEYKRKCVEMYREGRWPEPPIQDGKQDIGFLLYEERSCLEILRCAQNDM